MRRLGVPQNPFVPLRVASHSHPMSQTRGCPHVPMTGSRALRAPKGLPRGGLGRRGQVQGEGRPGRPWAGVGGRAEGWAVWAGVCLCQRLHTCRCAGSSRGWGCSNVGLVKRGAPRKPHLEALGRPARLVGFRSLESIKTLRALPFQSPEPCRSWITSPFRDAGRLKSSV